MYVCVYIYIYMYICIYICIYKSVYMYLYIYIHTYVHMYMYMYVCIYIWNTSVLVGIGPTYLFRTSGSPRTKRSSTLTWFKQTIFCVFSLSVSVHFARSVHQH